MDSWQIIVGTAFAADERTGNAPAPASDKRTGNASASAANKRTGNASAAEGRTASAANPKTPERSQTELCSSVDRES
jgi:hypothetical protein